MTKCQSRSATIDHSDPSVRPEMFTVHGRKGSTRIECLAHAAASEQRGRYVEIILT